MQKYGIVYFFLNKKTFVSGPVYTKSTALLIMVLVFYKHPNNLTKYNVIYLYPVTNEALGFELLILSWEKTHKKMAVNVMEEYCPVDDVE